jgi:hypothetical protein
MTAPGGDILAWLNDAIRYREETARAVGMDRFDIHTQPWGSTHLVEVYGAHRSVGPELDEDFLKHVVLHDPAAVLRRCAADRKLLALHQPVADHGRYSEPQCPIECDGQHSGPSVCASCRDYVGDPVEAPCPTVLLIAEGYGWTGGKR